MKLNKKIIIFFILVSNYLSAVKLSEIPQLNKLENYNELKNIEVEQTVDYDNYDRNGKYVYVHGETIPFSGVAIKRNKNSITGLYFYKKGKAEGIIYEYHDNGKLRLIQKYVDDSAEGKAIEYYYSGKIQSDRFYKDNVLQISTEYKQNGTIFRTYKVIDGLNGIRTVYYENGKDISSIAEVTQDYSQKKMINYRLNGKLKAYDKQGHLKAILNFKNDSIAGLPQEMYYPNGKLKYYAIAKDNNQKNPTFTEKAISYYDNGQEKENCDEVDSGMWMCKKYDKNGKFKGEVQKGGQPIETSNFWANFFMGVLNILLQ